MYHHQSIDRVADGLTVSARSADGVIEAVELESVPFGIAVQWHPEQTQEDLRLFAGLVDAARKYRLRGPARVEGPIVTALRQAQGAESRHSSTRPTRPFCARSSRRPLEQVDDAVARAVVAQRTWAALAPAERANALRRFAVDRGRSRSRSSHSSRCANSGHPIGQARWEAGHVRDVLNYYAAAPERMIGKQIPVAGGLDVTFLEPLGVVGVIVPWNFPMTIASWGFAPALAAGNAVVLKPAEWTPLTAMRIAELGVESGLPDGLFQVLPGRGSVIGDRFVTNESVRKIVFTGSTEVGKQVMAGCAEQVKAVTLELGGKSANVIFADSDLEKAAATAPYAVFENAGQDCCARSRILVERSVFDRFLELLEPAVKGVKVGLPGDESTEMGPLVAKSHFDKVASYVDDESRVAFRGSAPTAPGYWFAPTVLLPASRTDRTRHRGDLRPGRRPCCRSTTRPTPSRSPTTASTASPVRSGPGMSAGRSESREASRPATFR